MSGCAPASDRRERRGGGRGGPSHVSLIKPDSCDVMQGRTAVRTSKRCTNERHRNGITWRIRSANSVFFDPGISNCGKGDHPLASLD
jgi:hypothetical protein